MALSDRLATASDDRRQDAERRRPVVVRVWSRVYILVASGRRRLTVLYTAIDR